MPFELEHSLIASTWEPERHDAPDGTYFTLLVEGTFKVLHPGKLNRTVNATVRRSTRFDMTVPPSPTPPHGGIDQPGTTPFPTNSGTPRPLHNGVSVVEEGLAFTFHLLDPDGNEFTADVITLADIRRFRDRRGISRDWSFRLDMRSQTFVLAQAAHDSLYEQQATIRLDVIETIPPVSGPPLFQPMVLGHGTTTATFDLFRLGVFGAHISRTFPMLNWHGHMWLVDPDGVIVAESSSRSLVWRIPPGALKKSRTLDGKVRPWALRVMNMGGGPARLTAEVIAEGRIHTAVLQERFDSILGVDGANLEIFGRNANRRAQVVLKVNDVVAAETLDMFGVFDGLLRAQGDKHPDYSVGEHVVLYDRSSTFTVDALDTDFELDVDSIRVAGIDLNLGPARHLSAPVPAIRLSVRSSGSLKIKWDGHVLATVAPSNGRLELDVGMAIDPDGTPRIVQAINPDAISIDFDDAVVALVIAALSTLLTLPVGLVAAAEIHEAIEDYIDSMVLESIAKLFARPTLAPSLLMKLFGAHFSYRPPQFDGDDILFPHLAMVEIEPKPRRNYAGAIGRMVMDEAIGHVTFKPRIMEDTWAADNLKAKIDHIILVMMENRSYDHVLGHRALGPDGDGANGLTQTLIEGIATPPINHQIAPLKQAAFAAPGSPFPFTRIPVGVGHELADVTEQLAKKVDVAGVGAINDPAGFVANFQRRKLANRSSGYNPEDPDNPDALFKVMPDDVLGYYGRGDLPMYDFLADRFTYCGRFFCSHPGPTLPNRMYWLLGEPQFDRYGEPIIDNNAGDNFMLSAQPTIFDILSREGVGWRVYESFPSIATLRMFSRYASDVTNIRPFDEFLVDAAAGRLPAVTMVEPAMHHHPEDDDHPDADMRRGQLFIQKVYNALAANPAAWQRTLLIITYDEHGGLYDHVIPPIADVYNAEPLSAATGATSSSPGSAATGGASGGHSSAGASSGGLSTGGGHGWGHGVWSGDSVPPEALEVLATSVSDGLAPANPNVPIKVPYGVRVPTFVISPWVKPGPDASKVLDHCSIMKTVLACFCGDRKLFLSDRIRASHSFDSLLGADAPRPAEPYLDLIPQPPLGTRRAVSPQSMIDTPPLSRARMLREQVDYHEVSGRLARVLGR